MSNRISYDGTKLFWLNKGVRHSLTHYKKPFHASSTARTRTAYYAPPGNLLNTLELFPDALQKHRPCLL